jgi:hypothetical protein
VPPDDRPGWSTTTKSKTLLYEGEGAALLDGETVIHGFDTFS